MTQSQLLVIFVLSFQAGALLCDPGQITRLLPTGFANWESNAPNTPVPFVAPSFPPAKNKQACFDKWESNPELVPEECICAEDLDLEKLDLATAASSSSAPFGQDQASLGLDRYSVGYDLPLPSFFTSKDTVGNVNGSENGNAVVGSRKTNEQVLGGPVLETLEGIPAPPASSSPAVEFEVEVGSLCEDGESSSSGFVEGKAMSGRNGSYPDRVVP